MVPLYTWIGTWNRNQGDKGVWRWRMMSGCEKSSYHELKLAWCDDGKREDVCKPALQPVHTLRRGVQHLANVCTCRLQGLIAYCERSLVSMCWTTCESCSANGCSQKGLIMCLTLVLPLGW